MTITMQQAITPSIEEIKQFVSGSESVKFKVTVKTEAYQWLQTILIAVGYIALSKSDKGIVRAYVQIVTGYSRSTIARLIAQYVKAGHIRLETPNTRNQFAVRYGTTEISLLAEIDNAHDRLSGKAAKVLCQRAFVTFGDQHYEKLASISVSHIYNLRSTKSYQRQSQTYTKTQAVNVPIGERRKPLPKGQPGFIRVDTVHQGDKDGEKGVYHINLVDEVTQWEVVVAVEKISERYMIPALEAAMELFPFKLINFHADNGSEYINKKIAALLDVMRVKLTKSRAYHSGDNGLVETKNGSVIRKALGYAHIQQKHAPSINDWYRQWFVPYLNYHRPCGYRVTTVDNKTGKRTHSYPVSGYMMPYDKLRSLACAKQYLKPGISFEKLDKIAYAKSDTDWALAMSKAKAKLLKDMFN